MAAFSFDNLVICRMVMSFGKKLGACSSAPVISSPKLKYIKKYPTVSKMKTGQVRLLRQTFNKSTAYKSTK